ncbi:MAG TPA: phosphoribosylformylglycinamidine synthase subunit PurS [Bacteroidetes bacterium]|nr:phosphoribosylformylglycinamidine synthase subunit PurS [Bacteroidota bacterium]
MYHVVCRITLRPSILDPQGKAIHHALHDLGQTAVQGVRVGKRIELTIDAESEEAAREAASRACETLLANAVMEDFEVESATELEAA